MKKGDYLVIAAVLIISLLLFIPSFLPSGEKTAEVYYNGEKVKTVSLSSLEKEERFSVAGCEILFEKDGASFVKSDCKDQFCVKCAKLKNSGDSMACVPNRVVVAVKAEKDDDYDIMAY
ncbi:MAG: NusG domain II-containing protein [Acutalibacteraceae bacterium]